MTDLECNLARGRRVLGPAGAGHEGGEGGAAAGDVVGRAQAVVDAAPRTSRRTRRGRRRRREAPAHL